MLEFIGIVIISAIVYAMAELHIKNDYICQSIAEELKIIK
jgi:hypothetical protein